MELFYSPKAGASEKKYRHYTVNSFTEKELITEKKREFFYIGKDSFIIDSLVQSFESGYAAENVDNAISILSKVIEKRNIYPDVILADAAIGAPALQSFYKFIAGNRRLAAVPFLVESTDAAPRELVELRKLSFVDEIISMHRQSDKLLSKIYFIKKIKDASNIKSLQQNIGQSPDLSTVNNDIFKRIFDIVVAAIILLALLPVFGLIALAIRLESKGPVFYISKRAGRGYRVFNFFKFRTMEAGADKKVNQLSHLNQYNAAAGNGPVFFKVNNDPRITKVGAFLRNTSLDELPQFINVLLGDMSLVGNRPLPLYEAETLTTDDWAARFMAPAGITGLWQIKKRGQDDMSVEERIGLDIAYANRNNFMYDLWIMANTPTALIQKSSV
ncbi:MAG TPA: sugar transferase [Chitinophagaceae bacterium]|nr:sugar transferase [Chitinophagaceae bacterium]